MHYLPVVKINLPFLWSLDNEKTLFALLPLIIEYGYVFLVLQADGNVRSSMLTQEKIYSIVFILIRQGILSIMMKKLIN